MTERTQLVMDGLRYRRSLYNLRLGLADAKSHDAIMAMEGRIARVERLIDSNERRIRELDRAAAERAERGERVGGDRP